MNKMNMKTIEKIIKEEKLLIEEHRRFNDLVLREAKRMRKLNYDREILNEQLLDIIGQLGSSFIKQWKKQFALNILSNFGLHPQGFLADAIAEVFENMSLLQFRKYLGPEGCDELSELILTALTETALNPIVDGVMANLGVNPTTGLYGTIKDAVETQLQRGDLFQSLSSSLSGYICQLDVDDAVSAFTSSVDQPSYVAPGLNISAPQGPRSALPIPE